MTKETLNRLSQFEDVLYTAKKANYARISHADMTSLLQIYYGDDWMHKTSRSVLTCSSCKLREIIKIATEYFDCKDKL